MINCEATLASDNAHCQNCLSSKSLCLNDVQQMMLSFIANWYEIMQNAAVVEAIFYCYTVDMDKIAITFHLWPYNNPKFPEGMPPTLLAVVCFTYWSVFCTLLTSTQALEPDHTNFATSKRDTLLLLLNVHHTLETLTVCMSHCYHLLYSL